MKKNKKKFLFDKTYFESIPLKELQERYKDRLTEEQNKELEELIRMEENKYYQPSIEEFHVGFEYEITPVIPKNDFRKYVFPNHPRAGIEYPRLLSEFGIVESYLNNKQIRVKYLSKEDIESLGWTMVENTLFTLPDKNSPHPNSFYHLNFFDNNIIKIVKPFYDGIFLGEIKNKSELIKVLKQTGING
jgi:hypothetical protein